MLMFLVAVVSLSPSASDQRLSRMAELYEQVCLKAFPDDKAVEMLMKARNAPELSQDIVKVTMVDDPARAWDLRDGGATLWIEFPPFHACSVRWKDTQIGDLRSYRTIAQRYEASVGGFSQLEPYEADRGEIHIHAIGERRSLSNGGAESLFVFDQKISNPKRRDAGETGLDLRLVHQFAPPSGK